MIYDILQDFSCMNAMVDYSERTSDYESKFSMFSSGEHGEIGVVGLVTVWFLPCLQIKQFTEPILFIFLNKQDIWHMMEKHA